MLIFIAGIIIAVIAYRYIEFYAKSRRISFSEHKNALTVVVGCAVYNFIAAAAAGTELSYRELFIVFLMLLIADIDILIKKIPVELLTAYSAGICCVKLPEIKELPNEAAILFIGICFYIFRKKIGIALFDIYLFLISGFFVYPVFSQIKYAALFLIFWGTSALIIWLLQKNEKTVPLAPCIVLSYLICHWLNRL